MIVCPFVCRYIDQGRNPQLYTKECLERALARNEQVKGKIDTMMVSDNACGTSKKGICNFLKT